MASTSRCWYVTSDRLNWRSSFSSGQDDLKVGDGLFGKGVACRTDLRVGHKLSFALITVKAQEQGRAA